MDISLIRKAIKFVKEDKIKTTEDFRKDFLRHNFKEKEIKKTLISGLHFTKEELYPNPEKYVSKFYAIYKFFFKYILVGYIICNDHILLVHTNPVDRGWEIEQYKKLQKNKL